MGKQGDFHQRHKVCVSFFFILLFTLGFQFSLHNATLNCKRTFVRAWRSVISPLARRLAALSSLQSQLMTMCLAAAALLCVCVVKEGDRRTQQ